jgi:ATP-dependent DNA helicase RecG
MRYQDILDNIKNPEMEQTEFKSSFNDRDGIGRTMAAFATKSGGRIWLGIDDKGVPLGTTCSHDLDNKIQDLARVVEPNVTVNIKTLPHDTSKDLYIVCIEVNKGVGIHCYKGIAYERRGSTNHSLTPDEVYEIQKNIHKLYFDEMQANCSERPALISDISEDKIQIYYTLKGKKSSDKIDVRRFLLNHNLLIEGTMQVKNCAIFLFGKSPQKFIPQSVISLSKFPSEEITKDYIKKEFKGDLINIFMETFFEIQSGMLIYSFIEGMKRVEIPEYPPEIIREALINSIVHRDYFDLTTEIYVKIFTNRIEILNPASFPFENYSFEEIEKSGISKRRNPMIAKFFEEMGLMEQEGRGLPFMKNEAKKHGLPEPKIDVGKKTFKITFFKSLKTNNGFRKSPYRTVRDYEGLNNRQIKIIQYLQKNEGKLISRKDYIELTKTQPKTASRDLLNLYTRKVLGKTGEGKGTKYYLI